MIPPWVGAAPCTGTVRSHDHEPAGLGLPEISGMEPLRMRDHAQIRLRQAQNRPHADEIAT
jgi:hypothetical protein